MRALDRADAQTGDASQAHLANGLLVHERRLRQAHRRRVVVGSRDEAFVVELQLLSESLVEAEPGLVSLVTRRLVDGVESGDDGGRGGVGGAGDVVRVRADGQLPVDPQEEGLALGEQDDGAAFVAGARGAADAVHVLLAVGGEADLHDERDVGKVHAAADDVAGEHETGGGCFKFVGGSCAGVLRQAGLKLEHGHLLAEELREERVHERDTVRGCAEDDGFEIVRLELVLLQEDRVQRRVSLRDCGNDNRVLGDKLDSWRLVRIHSSQVGVAFLQDFGHDIFDLGRHSGGEAHALPTGRLGRQTAQDVVDRNEEARLQHSVGFIKNQSLNVREASCNVLV